MLADLPNGRQLAGRSLLKELLNGYIPPLPRQNITTRPISHPGRRSFWTNNVDIAVLRQENQNQTHVTPFIGQLAYNLFPERLEVVGPPPRPTDKELQRRQRMQRRTRLLRLLMASGRVGQKKIIYPIRERLRQQYWKCVYIDDVKYSVRLFKLLDMLIQISTLPIWRRCLKIGDVILIPIGPYAGREIPAWPENLEELPESKTLPDFFWWVLFHVAWFRYSMPPRFAKIIYIDSQVKDALHVQWFEHSSLTILEDLASPQELFLSESCSDLSCNLVSGKAVVHRCRPGDETSKLGPLDFFYA